MKKTILSLAVAEIIIGYSVQANAHAATIENIKGANENITAIAILQKSGKVISIGSKGDIVKSLQRVLNILEGCNIREDGLFGTETYNAVVKYQVKNGLKQDGIVGKLTAAKLISTDSKLQSGTQNSESKNGEELDSKKSVNAIILDGLNSKEINSDTNYFIVVSKSQRLVYIYYKETDYWMNIEVFHCNIGVPVSPTIEGNFYSGLKGKELRINETYVKYFTQISGDYLFYSVLYNELGEVIDDRLGGKISHGCIRLALEDAKYIYDVIPARTGIRIMP